MSQRLQAQDKLNVQSSRVLQQFGDQGKDRFVPGESDTVFSLVC